uniref:Putative secreted protein n=1 Tax=Anopheles marajoara TaxID=58244 RepID=A0A2M4C8S6_9DIPT
MALCYLLLILSGTKQRILIEIESHNTRESNRRDLPSDATPLKISECTIMSALIAHRWFTALETTKSNGLMDGHQLHQAGTQRTRFITNGARGHFEKMKH